MPVRTGEWAPPALARVGEVGPVRRAACLSRSLRQWDRFQSAGADERPCPLGKPSLEDESSSSESAEWTTCPLHANSFFIALRSLRGSYLSGMPATVVMVLRPLRCWRRMWILSAVLPTLRSIDGLSSPKGSEDEKGSER